MKTITATQGSAVTSGATIEKASETKQFVTFKVSSLFLGIELSHIQELMRYQEMTTVPLSPAAVEGLINLRGQIVTALDLRRILGIVHHDDNGPRPMNIVVHSEGGPVSFLVDEICDVVDIPVTSSDQTFAQLPGTLPPEQRALLMGVHQLASCLLLVVNTERVILAGAL